MNSLYLSYFSRISAADSSCSFISDVSEKDSFVGMEGGVEFSERKSALSVFLGVEGWEFQEVSVCLECSRRESALWLLLGIKDCDCQEVSACSECSGQDSCVVPHHVLHSQSSSGTL